DFKDRVNKGIHDSFMRGAVAGAQERMGTRRNDAAAELGNWEDWRSHGEEIRQHVLEHLDYYLEQLSENVARRGGHVFFAEYILQVDDHEPPSHIVVPALHKNKEQIRDVFTEKLGYQKTSKPEELAGHARQKLREEFLSADVGITGCNFAVAETGSFSLVTNEGNADLVTALPKTQITVMGMERLVPTFEEMEVLVSLLTRSAVGQKLTSYITVLT
ncbi:LUD domain-containing protein, partial [Frankia sp. AgKG'84/4]|nr:LUD domain-containing protein [Frankia sp. AgKG'84/4]